MKKVRGNLMSNDNNEILAEQLKDFILDIEGKASKEIISSKGLTAIQSSGYIASSAVSAILNAVDILCKGDLQ